MECPYCGSESVFSHPTGVDDESYAQVKSSEWSNVYKGVQDAAVIEDGGTYGLRLEVDQSAYSTENHFKHRKQHEGGGAIEIVDVEPGVVEAWFRNVRTTITAFRCDECETVWDDELGELQ